MRQISGTKILNTQFKKANHKTTELPEMKKKNARFLYQYNTKYQFMQQLLTLQKYFLAHFVAPK